MRAFLQRLWTPIWSLFFLVLIVGAPATTLMIVLSYSGAFDVSAQALAEANRSSLFSTMLGAASFFVSVMLAVLAIITSMDERPIIKRMKEQPGMYEQLIDSMLGSVFSMLLLGALSIVCILVPGRYDVFTGESVLSFGPLFMVAFTIALGVTGFAQATWVAMLLSRLLRFKGRQPLLTEADSPEAARAQSKAMKARERETPTTRTASPAAV